LALHFTHRERFYRLSSRSNTGVLRISGGGSPRRAQSLIHRAKKRCQPGATASHETPILPRKKKEFEMKRLPILSPLLAALAPIPVLVLATAIVFPAPAAAEGPAKLTLTVTGIKDVKGALMIAVFDQAGYDADKPVAQAAAPVTAASVTTTFDLPAGEYGIKMFHDVDGDGKMGTNPFGLPLEPYGFSNNAPAQFGPATWDAAAFKVAAPATTASIKLN
jgi:uncharacterized protein (DUF2141 family)